MAENSPLSYQTTMPEYPDLDYQTYLKTYLYKDSYDREKALAAKFGHEYVDHDWYNANRMWNEFDAWNSGKLGYNDWRTNQLDSYNGALGAYKIWLESGAGQRASAESGNYNPSYFEGAGSPSASPLSYGQTSASSGFSEMAQGISGIFQFAQAIQSVRLMASQIAGQNLKNQAQKINNLFLERILSGRVSGQNLRNDRQQFELEQLFYPRWSNRPELWKAGVFSPYGRETYDLRDAERGLGYQRAVADLDYLKAGKALRDSQSALMDASTREKKWYYDNVLKIEKEILENQNKILAGEYDFQKTEQRLRKAGIISNIGVGVINAAVNAVKAFSPAGLLGSGSGSLSAPSWKPPFSSPVQDGLDMSGFGSWSPFE